MAENTAPTRDSPPDPPHPGSVPAPSRQTIGAFTIRREIASGGMGVVYEAMQSNPHRPVALKIMRMGLASASSRQRFDHEAAVLAALRHPGIVQIYDAGVHRADGQEIPYIAMEFVPGALTLKHYVAEKSLDTRAIVTLMVQVCSAVSHGHSRGVIHRDLKPSNILIDSEGNPKLIDFGIARSLASDAAPLTLQTEVGQLIGTVQYMSPEQIDSDSRTIDARADVYSLGIVLYELLSGHLPFQLSGKSISEATRIIKAGAALKLSALIPGIDTDLNNVVMKAIACDRTDRFPSVDELAAELQRFLNGEPSITRPLSPFAIAARAWKSWARRERVASFLIVIAAATTLAWGAGILAFGSAGMQRVLATLQPSLSAPAITSLDHSVIIKSEIDPTKPDQVRTFFEDCARRSGTATSRDMLETLAADPTAMRSVYATLLRNLKFASPKAVVVDLYFSPAPDSPNTQLLLQAIADLRVAGVPVICLTRKWMMEPAASATNSLERAPSIDPAGGTADVANGAAIVFLAAQRPPYDVAPGIALAALAAFRHNSMHFDYSFDSYEEHISVAAHNRDNPAQPTEFRDAVTCTSLQALVKPLPEFGLRTGDLVSTLAVKPPPPEEFAAHTWSLAESLAPSFPLQCAGKVVFLTPGSRDSKLRLDSSTTIDAFQSQVAAFELLLQRGVLTVPGAGFSIAIASFSVALSALCTLPFRRIAATHIALPAACAAALIPPALITLMAPPVAHLVINAFVPALAGLLAAAALLFTIRRPA